ncbi:hypothetical protein BP5796_09052 [Coleophoma crateriformis]|uniref:Uncharacterized protein n=1 Tax=Coleophoma crateriformis TaxID=565419 RepID=A0A3D8R2X4_9HELO|nr:hypothetical protein BP5796_09052 [Coleophoma crateriformis]
MGSFSQTRSPILALPPQLPHHPSFNMECNRPMFSSPFNNPFASSPTTRALPTHTPTGYTPSSRAGRKRSRDEAAENLEDDYFPSLPVPTVPAPAENEDEWVYGEGMTLIKPNAKYIMPAESQSGTWIEDKTEPQQAPTPAQSPERPALRPHKSQRLHLAPTSDILEEISLSSGSLMTPLSSTSGNGPASGSGPKEPTVDDFTRHLGIGWSLISADQDIQAAARGWTKYIENHFPVSNAKIRLQSRGLASYLVEANEGYFLFGEDLKQGRLVSQSIERVLKNLQTNPPVFDGETTMDASATPKLDHGLSGTTIMQQESGSWNHTPSPMPEQAVQNMEVEMDMS